MAVKELIDELRGKEGVAVSVLPSSCADEVYLGVERLEFRKACLFLHKRLHSPAMMLFAEDVRRQTQGYSLRCAFLAADKGTWVFVQTALPQDDPVYDSLASHMYSATLFERSILEMFGIHPAGSPDPRPLALHPEVWPEGSFPLRKDFIPPAAGQVKGKPFPFARIEGEGIFEVPVGPVHAGIIGPGHFRFSVAGEPIVNLEIRLGFTHRGVEKMFEGRTPAQGVGLAERVSGDAVVAHSLAFCQAVERACAMPVPRAASCVRAICLELERMYNHAADLGGMALDVGFSFPAQYASLIKERILRLNENLFGHRYLKGVVACGGVTRPFADREASLLQEEVEVLLREFKELKEMLLGSVSFMDRADETGVLRKKTAEDFGVVGVAGRASGVPLDLRKAFPGVYAEAGFLPAREEKGDVLARLRVRIFEFEESCRLVRELCGMCYGEEARGAGDAAFPAGFALGSAEGWRGPVCYWVRVGADGTIERCVVVDASLRNWQGLSYAVLGNIIPDFPLCNKSFDLSYAGNDL